MRDGTRLYTNVFLPNSSLLPAPAILMRTPYGAEEQSRHYEKAIAVLVDREGYVMVIQAMRGTHESQGENHLFWDDGWGELQDGYDTIEWVARQSWCNGKVGTYGGSAQGIVQYLAAGASPPHLKAAFVLNAAWSLYDFVYQGGEFRKHDVETWVREKSTPGMLDFLKLNYSNDIWGLVNAGTRKGKVKIPMVHIGGWFDCFSPSQIEAFRALQYQGGDGARGRQKLIIGPWTHQTRGGRKCGEITFPENAAGPSLYSLVPSWFNRWLRGEKNGIEKLPAVQIYLMGPVNQMGYWNNWFYYDGWPFDDVKIKVLYLQSGGLLSPNPPSGGYSTYKYDPSNPVPTVGGNNLTLEAGMYDQSRVWKRDDVLTFETERAIFPYDIFGKVRLVLFVSSTAPDTDFTAKLVDIYPDGRKMLILDSILMARHRRGLHREDFLQSGKIYKMEINLGYTAYTIAPGHRLGLAISSSNYPKYAVNPNTGEPLNQATYSQVAENTVYFGKSRLILPLRKNRKGMGWRR